MNPLLKLWNKASNAGVSPQMPFYAAQKRNVFNRINTSVGLLAIAWMAYWAFNPFANPALLWVSATPVLCCAVCTALMLRKRFSAALTLAFAAFPPVVALYAACFGEALFLFYHFVLCALAFFFLRRQRTILMVNAYVLVWFVIGHLLHQHKSPAGEITTVFLAVTVFAITYVAFNGIQAGVMKYEKGMRIANRHLQTAAREVEVQKQRAESYSANLEEKTASLAELNEVKTRLFSILSHDLRGHVYDMQKAVAVADEQKDEQAFFEILPSLKKQAAETAALLENILAWSKTLIHSAQPIKEPVEVGHLVLGITRFYESAARKKNLHFNTNFQKSLVSHADRNMLETVFRSIIGNAIKFSRPGLPINVEGERNCATLSIKIIDCGAGMQQQELNSLLASELAGRHDPFTEQGSGMGLLLSRELLQKNDGTLTITSRQGMGTSVEVKLPLLQDVLN